ncbi:MAG: hypothetical protein WCT85_00775 [Parachlamydiales bacterium]|jgi:hypothetical protein
MDKKYSKIEDKISDLVKTYDADLILYMLDEIAYFLKGIDYKLYKKILDYTGEEFQLNISQIIPINNNNISKKENPTNARRIIAVILTEQTTFDIQTISRLLKVTVRGVYSYINQFQYKMNNANYPHNKNFIDKYKAILNRINHE